MHIQAPSRVIASVMLGTLCAGIAWRLASPSRHVSAAEILDAASLRQQILAMEEKYAAVQDYSCLFYKQELVDGKLLPRETIQLKFRKPFSIYMKWIAPPHKGQEVLYREGWNNGKMRAHRGSFPDITLNLSPDSSRAMSGNRHRITEAGLGMSIRQILQCLEKAEQHPESPLQFIDQGIQMVENESSQCMDIVSPAGGQVRYYSFRTRLCISRASGLPTRIASWDYQNILFEEYVYAQCRLNIALQDIDFDPRNPAYNF